MNASEPVCAKPVCSDSHLFDSEHGNHVLLVDGSRIYDIDAALRERLRASSDPAQTLGLARGEPYVDEHPPAELPLRALSLAVAQKCNLGCGYCYAEGGGFGGAAQDMSWAVARASVERLLEHAQPGESFSLAFLGGEPLSNRPLLRRAAEYASALARQKRATLGLSITTNGTLLNDDDAAFFARHRFAVTVSLDGVGAIHDKLRPFKSGRPSYQRIVDRMQPLLAKQDRVQVSARVTVSAANLRLRETLDTFTELGFHSVGFAPLLSTPSGSATAALAGGEFAALLEQMIDCGDEFQRRLKAGQRYPFSNLETALWEIHRGTHRPYPCGAGAGYVGVSARGGLYACHRFVDDEKGALGDVDSGLDPERRSLWLAQRHVHQQTDCQRCWARYLCGGGCHHEVLSRGRPACDYIRSWLHYCLQTYVNVMQSCPDYFHIEPDAEHLQRRAKAVSGES